MRQGHRRTALRAAATVKRLLNAGESRSFEEHLADEAQTIAKMASSQETLAKLEAFFAKQTIDGTAGAHGSTRCAVATRGPVRGERPLRRS